LNESLEETAARRETDRLRAMSRRAAAQQQSSCARHDIHDQRRLGRLAANLTKFRQSLLLGPLANCYSCSRYTYPSGGSYVDSDNAMLQLLHGCANQKIPSFSVVNNMHVAPVPPELSCLNVTEKRLICRVQAFMKLVVLPYRQRDLQGQALSWVASMSLKRG